jgi:hypothetical protein
MEPPPFEISKCMLQMKKNGTRTRVGDFVEKDCCILYQESGLGKKTE